jgi:hypothetical protein
MNYQVILTDIDNYRQFIVSLDHSIINKVFSIKGDIPIKFEDFNKPFIVVQKTINNKTDEKLNLSDSYEPYYYYIDDDNIHYKFKLYQNNDKKDENHEEINI